VPDAFVLETLRTTRTKASPRGTMAMGRGFGASGAIMLGCVVDELERRGGRYRVAVSGAEVARG
jgi:acetyl-CoA acetyltransferase